jgi:hypothetical protein
VGGGGWGVDAVYSNSNAVSSLHPQHLHTHTTSTVSSRVVAGRRGSKGRALVVSSWLIRVSRRVRAFIIIKNIYM